MDGTSGPETEVGSVLCGKAGDGNVVCDGKAFLTTRPDSTVGVGDVLDVTEEADRVRDIETGNLPGLWSQHNTKPEAHVLPVEPRVRSFELFTIAGNELLEDTVRVAASQSLAPGHNLPKTVAPAWEVESSHTVNLQLALVVLPTYVASSQTAETTISETSITLLVEKVLKVLPLAKVTQLNSQSQASV